MTSKTNVFITGANAGIGLEVVKALLTSQTPYHIFLGSRSIEKAEDACAALQKQSPNNASKITVVQIDISSDVSISSAFEKVKSEVDHIDVLVNNAGVSLDAALAKGEISVREAWTNAYDINVTGSQITTYTFMPLLIKSSSPRLLFVTSGTSSLAETAAGRPSTLAKVEAGWPKPPQFSFTAYQSSKAAMNMMMLNWVRLLKEDNVRIWCISPGFLATSMGGIGAEVLKKMGAGDPSIGGHFIKDVVEGKRDEDVGKVINSTGVQPW